MRAIIRLSAIGLLSLGVSGCVADAAGGVAGAVINKLFEPSPTRIEAKIKADPDINPDFDGQASPLVVRLYELKSPTAFNSAGFFALYDGDLAELGADMQNREELELQPGQELEVMRDLKPETRYIGIMAAYRDIDNAAWRAVHPVEEHETAELTIAVRRLDVSIAPTE